MKGLLYHVVVNCTLADDSEYVTLLSLAPSVTWGAEQNYEKESNDAHESEEQRKSDFSRGPTCFLFSVGIPSILFCSGNIIVAE